MSTNISSFSISLTIITAKESDPARGLNSTYEKIKEPNSVTITTQYGSFATLTTVKG